MIVGSAVALAGLKAASIVGGYGLTFLRGGLLNVVGAFYRTEAAARAASATTAAAQAGPTMLGRAFIGLGNGMKTAAGRVPVLGGALGHLGGAFQGATRGAKALRLALLSTGVGAIAVGIGAAAGLIYKYWEPIGSFMSGLWRGIGSAMAPVVKQFGGLIDRLGPVGDMIQWVGGKIGDAIGWFRSLFEPVDTTQKKLQSFADTGEAIGQTIGAVFANIASAIGDKIDWIIGKFEAVGNAYGAVKRFFGFGDAERLELPDTTPKTPKVGDVMKDRRPAANDSDGAREQPMEVGDTLKSRRRDGDRDDPNDARPKIVNIGDAERQRPVYRPPTQRDDEAAPVPLRRAAGAETSVDARQTVNLTINQLPGEDSEALADRAVAKMKEHERRERRGALYDDGPSYGF